MFLVSASQIGSNYWDLSVGGFAAIVFFLCFFALIAVALVISLVLSLRSAKNAAEQDEQPVEDVPHESEDVQPVEDVEPVESAQPATEQEPPQQPPRSPEREPVIIAEESFAGGILRYDRSFTARLIQSDDEVKNGYTDLKNLLLSYAKVHLRMSWKRETFRIGGDVVARLAFRGETLCVYLPLDPNDYADTKYKTEDASDSVAYADTPLLYRLKNPRRFKYAAQLIDEVMAKRGAQQTDREAQDYYLPYEGLMELIKKGLVKRNVKAAGSEAIFHRGEEAEEEDTEPIEVAPGIFVVPDDE